MPRPTRALALALLGALVLNLVSRSSGNTWIALTSGAVLALPLASLLLRPPLAGVRVELRGQRVVAGEEVEILVRVLNTGRRESPPATWRHGHPALEAVETSLPALAPRQSTELVLSRRAHQRGIHHWGTAELTTTAPFGLLRWSHRHEVIGSPLVVHPATGTSGRLLDGGAGTAAERSLPVPGAGMEVLDLRPWRPGDARREVSARASARHGRPVVLQRERDAGPTLVILASGGGSGPAWEHAVSSAASTALMALRDGQPPIVIADPPPSRIDSVGLLDFFAGVDHTGPLREVHIRSAAQRVGRGGTLLLLAAPGAAAQVRRVADGCPIEVLHVD